MKKWIIVSAAFFLALAIRGAATAATPPVPAYPYAVETDRSAIDGHTVVYERKWDADDYDIYATDLNTGTYRSVSSSTDDDRCPDISGDIVVWQRKTSSGRYQIYWKDLNTSNLPAPVHEVAEDQLTPKISGTRVVWRQYHTPPPPTSDLGSFDIVGYDLATNTYYPSIATSGDDESSPDISGTTVVYQRYMNLGTDSFPAWRMQIFKTTFDSINAGTRIWNYIGVGDNQYKPVISSTGKAAWRQHLQVGEYEPSFIWGVVWVDDVWAPPYLHIMQDRDIEDDNPALFGNILVWRHQYDTGSTNYDIYMKSIIGGDIVILVAGSEHNQLEPAVGGDSYHGIFVSYTDTKDGYNRVYWRKMIEGVKSESKSDFYVVQNQKDRGAVIYLGE